MSPMYFNKFSVRIHPGREGRDGYVMIPHGATFKLLLKNDLSEQQCDAQVVIGGRDCGTFRIAPNQTVTLERPIHDEGLFTFYEAGTPEFVKANGHLEDKRMHGLVAVTFTPEVMRQPVVHSYFNSGEPSHFQPNMYGAHLKSTADWQSNQRSLTGDDDGGASGSLGDDEPVAMASTGGNWGQPRVEFSAQPPAVPASSKSGTVGLSGHSNQTFVPAPLLTYDYQGQTTIKLRLISDHQDEPRPLGPISTPEPPPLNR